MMAPRLLIAVLAAGLTLTACDSRQSSSRVYIRKNVAGPKGAVNLKVSPCGPNLEELASALKSHGNTTALIHTRDLGLFDESGRERINDTKMIAMNLTNASGGFLPFASTRKYEEVLNSDLLNHDLFNVVRQNGCESVVFADGEFRIMNSNVNSSGEKLNAEIANAGKGRRASMASKNFVELFNKDRNEWRIYRWQGSRVIVSSKVFRSDLKSCTGTKRGMMFFELDLVLPGNSRRGPIEVSTDLVQLVVNHSTPTADFVSAANSRGRHVRLDRDIVELNFANLASAGPKNIECK